MDERLTDATTGRRRIRAVFCSVMTREVCLCAARARNLVEPIRVPSGLHDLGAERMSARLQETIDRADADGDAAEAIVLLYGLCNNGVVGLRARRSPLVIPRAHDCITLLLGSKERYARVFDEEPGTYYFTPGWVESSPETNLAPGTVRATGGIPEIDFEALVAQYGEDNARYLAETMDLSTTRYKRYLWIGSEVGEFPEYVERIREKAAKDGKRFEEARGELTLIQRALDGPWDEADFCRCEPGEKIVARVSDGIIDTTPV